MFNEALDQDISPTIYFDCPAICNETPGRPASVSRIILTEKQAVDIFNQKPGAKNTPAKGSSTSQSRIVAEKYGVSPKTVRDIWNRKTWSTATLDIDCKTIVTQWNDANYCRSKVAFRP